MSYLASKSNLCCSYVTVSLPRSFRRAARAHNPNRFVCKIYTVCRKRLDNATAVRRTPRSVSDERLLETINSFDGVNVTMPFKTRVAALLRAVRFAPCRLLRKQTLRY